MTKKTVRRFSKPEWSIVQDKTKYNWMRIERNKILIMYDKSKMKHPTKGCNVWDGEVTFDEEVFWQNMIEYGDLVIFPSNCDDCIILEKANLLTGEQEFFHWKHGFYTEKSWADKTLYTNAKRYNYKNRN